MSGKRKIDIEANDSTSKIRNVLIISIAIMTLVLGLLYLRDVSKFQSQLPEVPQSLLVP